MLKKKQTNLFSSRWRIIDNMNNLFFVEIHQLFLFVQPVKCTTITLTPPRIQNLGWSDGSSRISRPIAVCLNITVLLWKPWCYREIYSRKPMLLYFYVFLHLQQYRSKKVFCGFPELLHKEQLVRSKETHSICQWPTLMKKKCWNGFYTHAHVFHPISPFNVVKRVTSPLVCQSATTFNDGEGEWWIISMSFHFFISKHTRRAISMVMKQCLCITCGIICLCVPKLFSGLLFRRRSNGLISQSPAQSSVSSKSCTNLLWCTFWSDHAKAESDTIM